MEVALQQVVGETLVDGRMAFLFQLTGTQVAEEATLHEDGVLFQTLGGDDQQDQHTAEGQQQSGSRIDQPSDREHQDTRTEHDTQYDQRDQRPTVEFAIMPQLLELSRMVLFHHDGTQHGRDHSQDQL